MKTAKKTVTGLLALSLLWSLPGCERDMTIRSDVHADGSIDRTIVIFDDDSSGVSDNILHINQEKGWEVSAEKTHGEGEANGKKDDKQMITFRKSFSSVDDANREMDAEVDTLFRIHGDFEKKFRWFYTYFNYSDTYRSLNRFPAVSQDDYFTKEDYAFISRLPAEGEPISKADSIYLARLNEKIFDLYALRTIYEEMFKDLLGTMEAHHVDTRWQDSLQKYKERFFPQLKEFNDENDFMLAVADSLDIPLSPDVVHDYLSESKELERRIEFVSSANSVKFHHVIRVPGTVVGTNADSVSAEGLFWRPPPVKYLLGDYAMTVKARKLNLWAVIVSGIIVFVTIGLFIKKRVGSRGPRLKVPSAAG